MGSIAKGFSNAFFYLHLELHTRFLFPKRLQIQTRGSQASFFVQLINPALLPHQRSRLFQADKNACMSERSEFTSGPDRNMAKMRCRAVSFAHFSSLQKKSEASACPPTGIKRSATPGTITNILMRNSCSGSRGSRCCTPRRPPWPSRSTTIFKQRL